MGVSNQPNLAKRVKLKYFKNELKILVTMTCLPVPVR